MIVIDTLRATVSMSEFTVSRDGRSFANRVARDVREFITSVDTNPNFRTYIDSTEGSTILFTVYFVHGLYASGHFQFTVSIPSNYPFSAPRIQSAYPIYHPNVNLHTREVYIPLDWSPVLTLSSYMLALKLMFLEFSGEKAQNSGALAEMNENVVLFQNKVKHSLRGGMLDGISTPIQFSDMTLCNRQGCYCRDPSNPLVIAAAMYQVHPNAGQPSRKRSNEDNDDPFCKYQRT